MFAVRQMRLKRTCDLLAAGQVEVLQRGECRGLRDAVDPEVVAHLPERADDLDRAERIPDAHAREAVRLGACPQAARKQVER